MTVVISLFLVSIGVYAATTIGTNVTTEGYATSTVGYYTQGLLDVGGAATVRGAATIDGAATIGGDATTTGDFVISGGDINKDGTDLTFGGYASSTGGLYTMGILDVGGAATVRGNATIGGYVTTTVGLYTDGVLDVGGAATIRDTLTLNGLTETGLDIDMVGAGADANYYGIDADVIQSTIAGGAFLSRGNLQGIRSDANAIGNIDHVYAMRSGATLAMSAASESNQIFGGLFSAAVTGTGYTLTISDMVSGISSSVSVAADVTNVVVRAGDPGYSLGAIRAAYFDSSGVLADTTAEVSTVYIKAGGASYTDYGLQIHTESNNLTAAAMIKTFGSNLLPIGLQFNGANSGTITNAINFTGTVTNVLDFASTDGTNGADISARFVGADITGADAAVKIDIGGTSYYIPAWVAGDVTGSW